MAIYHFHAQVISRADGRSAVNAAAYRRGEAMQDQRLQERFSYEQKEDVSHSELTIPQDAPTWVRELHEMHATDPRSASEALWNRVEMHEKRSDAQLAREINAALPTELTKDQQIAMVREFVADQLSGRGMVADWSIHDADGHNPHAHIMLTMRPVTENGFGARKVPVRDLQSGEVVRDAHGKIRYQYGDQWGSKVDLETLREQWAAYQNYHLALNGQEARVDHRSYREQGLEVAPASHVGVHASSMAERGKISDRVAEAEREREERARALEAKPELLLDLVTSRRAVFTSSDLHREVARHVDDPQRSSRVLAGVEASPKLVQLSPEVRNANGRVVQAARYSTTDMIHAEARLVESADRLASAASHGAAEGRASAVFERHTHLSEEQRAAVLHVTGEGRLAIMVGAAGAGKSTTLGAAREVWEAEGYRVRGAALAGKAADGLSESAGIQSRTIHSLEYAWKNGREHLSGRDVLVIDEAGMVGSRQLGRVLEHAEAAGAKVVLVGDARQLQPIEAGAPFRAVAERVGVVELETIRRQDYSWARQASHDFAQGRVADGLAAYRERGEVHLHGSRLEAKDALAKDWMGQRGAGSSIILAHTNEDVRDLNLAIREARRDASELGADAAYSTTRGERQFAVGDRVVFLANDRELEVRNGTLGTIEEARKGELAVRLDNGQQLRVNEDRYANIDHGYAVTIHKAQGVTVDRAQVLATEGMDRHLTYVAMTRHRDQVTVYAGRDDFADHRAMDGCLSRARPKESTLDFAERRGIEFTEKEPTTMQQARSAGDQDVRERWNDAVAREFASVSNRAQKLEEQLGTQLERHRERIATHQAQRPEPPGGISRALGGTAQYAEAKTEWDREGTALARRERELSQRVERVHEYAREPLPGYSSKGTELAARLAERQDPEVASAMREVRGREQEQRRDSISREIAERSERSKDQGIER